MPFVDPNERLPRGDMIDVRSSAEFRSGHFASAISVPVEEIADCMHALPDRDRTVFLFGSPQEIDRARAILDESGFADVQTHPAAGPFASPRGAIESPWVAGGGERVRLWSATPFFEAVWREVAPEPDVALLDVACGSGRNGCWAALGEARVIGLDHHPDAVDRASDLAQRCARAVEVRREWLATRGRDPGPPYTPPEWRRVDLEADWPVAPSSIDWIVCVRFLFRPLFPRLFEALRPGGHLVFQTFTEEQRRFGRPKRAEFLLAPGELRAIAEQLGLETRRYEESCPPGGPALASLWATKPAEPTRTEATERGLAT